MKRTVFDLEAMNYLCFWAKKAKNFEFTKNNMAALNNERLAKI